MVTRDVTVVRIYLREGEHLIVEFYDDPAKIEGVIATLIDELHLTHILSWSALAHARVT